MILLVDAGNTRLKWAWLSDRGVGAQSVLVHRGVPEERWTTALPQSAPAPGRVLVSNVAGPAMARILTAWAIARFGVAPEFPTAAAERLGLVNAYLDPHLLGVDRWLALLGAWTAHRVAACVVDVGTATKVDAVDAAGRHLGGLIAPGIAMMRESLMTGTSDIAGAAARSTTSSAGVLADNTVAAVDRGAVLAAAGLAERAADVVEAHLGARPTLLITGGDAAEVARAMRSPAEVVPGLVLEGLAALARDTAAPRPADAAGRGA